MMSWQHRKSTNKSSEPKTWGQLFKKLRSSKKIPQQKVLLHYHNEMEKINPDYRIRNESWLNRIERGETQKVSRQEMEILFTSINCTHAEKMQLFMLADRNVFRPPSEVLTPELEYIYFLMEKMQSNKNVCKMICFLLRDRRASTLDEAEIYEIMKEVIHLRENEAYLAYLDGNVL